ncbi:SpoVR family protein [Tengunoibacter tsumagoiensis]|uniref:Stage V sporulation protein R n=1 Tax=Tengunoibacter tsumagoiensis TaxID=2014871 RepID=A0A402A457_9CHLR|nr:SpoVR family protein [Tengunoibacter tsumagoiensis]GCE13918.1 stage V sporulation protein R [Tengunoibacter tsumagoiensis]
MTIYDAQSEMERLRDGIDAAWEEARKFGLDPFPTHFELVPAAIMYEFASYSLPGRFSHWTHGKAYHRQKMQYDLGLSKIYEMVVNTNPSYAFLMEMNNMLQNTFVAAHVFGHTDFFKNNAYFQHTSRRMIDKVSIHAERIAKYEFDHGKAEVERFLDSVLSIQEHVDYNLLLRENENDATGKKAGPLSSEYDDLWGLEEKAKKVEEERDARPGKPPKFPEKPEKDLLLFFQRYAPHLQPWQRDLLEIVHTEMLYFVPQMQTKVMNEGWASIWHSRIMRQLGDKDVITDSETVEFAQLHSSVLTPSRTSLNPYYLGFKIFEDIERRWDSPSTEEQERLGRKPGMGRQKIFEVREIDNDVSFLRNYLTEDLVKDLDLYVYKKEGDDWVIAEKNWQKVRDTIVANMTNFGYPYLVVENGDYRGNRELYLKHLFEGQELDLGYAEKTLQHVYTIWGRPVHLETMFDGKRILLTYDGERNSKSTLEK